ncbi:hypothetical protein O6H91_08G020500 [Diphasiastrum complanatum]|uniref:Uncharacterized protein n=1 Tax=Diphasiastrum complanatum TaxID=34168 RepID=A0ACC2CVL4_DIPCM|nr:hypothetical protein O6H91_08G020500 [Diphasiastrum complanatum]
MLLVELLAILALLVVAGQSFEHRPKDFIRYSARAEVQISLVNMQNRSKWKFLYVGSLVFFAYLLFVAFYYGSSGTQVQAKTEIFVITGDEEEIEMEFSEDTENPCSLYAGRKMMDLPCTATMPARRSLMIYSLADYEDPSPNVNPPRTGHIP